MIQINGKTYQGRSVSIVNNRVVIDGIDVTDKDMPKTILDIHVTGDLVSLETTASVSCENVQGDVIAKGSVNCDDIKGSVYASGSVNCSRVGGNVRARGSVNHG